MCPMRSAVLLAVVAALAAPTTKDDKNTHDDGSPLWVPPLTEVALGEHHLTFLSGPLNRRPCVQAGSNSNHYNFSSLS